MRPAKAAKDCAPMRRDIRAWAAIFWGGKCPKNRFPNMMFTHIPTIYGKKRRPLEWTKNRFAGCISITVKTGVYRRPFFLLAHGEKALKILFPTDALRQIPRGTGAIMNVQAQVNKLLVRCTKAAPLAPSGAGRSSWVVLYLAVPLRFGERLLPPQLSPKRFLLFFCWF